MIVGNDDLFILVAKEPSGRYSPYDQQDRTIVYKFIQIIFKYKTRLFGACSGHGLAKNKLPGKVLHHCQSQQISPLDDLIV